MPSAHAAIRSACGFPVDREPDGHRGVPASRLDIAEVRPDERSFRDQDRLEHRGAAVTGEQATLFGVGHGPVETAQRALADDRSREDVDQRMRLAACRRLTEEPIPFREASLEIVRPAEHVGQAERRPAGDLADVSNDPLALERPFDHVDRHPAGQPLLVASDASQRRDRPRLVSEALGELELRVAVRERLPVVLSEEVERARHATLQREPQRVVAAGVVDRLPVEGDALVEVECPAVDDGLDIACLPPLICRHRA